MSLINDALKRAKQAQQQQPAAAATAPALQFKPLEPVQGTGSRKGVLAAAALAVVAVVILGLAWQLSHSPRQAEAAATEPSGLEASHQSPQSPASHAAAPTPEPSPLQVAARTPAPEPATAPAPAPAPVPAVTANVTNSAPVSASNAVVAQTVAPKPPPLRVQAIFFSPTHPSAMLAGKTLSVGDRFNEFKVAQITQESVTLVSAAGTKVLSLGQ